MTTERILWMRFGLGVTTRRNLLVGRIFVWLHTLPMAFRYGRHSASSHHILILP